LQRDAPDRCSRNDPDSRVTIHRVAHASLSTFGAPTRAAGREKPTLSRSPANVIAAAGKPRERLFFTSGGMFGQRGRSMLHPRTDTPNDSRLTTHD
jgi:hypothetical protein